MATVTSENREEFIKKELDKKNPKKKSIYYHGTNQEKLKPQEHRLFWITPEKKHAEKYAEGTVIKYGGKPKVHEVEMDDENHKYISPTQFFRLQAKHGDKEAFEEARKQGYTAVKSPDQFANAIALLHPSQVKFASK